MTGSARVGVRAGSICPRTWDEVGIVICHAMLSILADLEVPLGFVVTTHPLTLHSGLSTVRNVFGFRINGTPPSYLITPPATTTTAVSSEKSCCQNLPLY
jgi:hypothetical protein